MRTFRITLSHGDEHITFDGAGARSGSMFHVRRAAIEGLWSSPASKVSLTERETANGASPISDGETLYAARTVSIPFAIQSNYNHTELIRARTLLGRLIGWHDVRMDINDDGDETVLYGYIEAKYSDIPYDHADAGVITVVCPDPRRVSKHESTISMNTSSSSLGGLLFTYDAHELIRNPDMRSDVSNPDGWIGWNSSVALGASGAPSTPPTPFTTYAKVTGRDHLASWTLPNIPGRVLQYTIYAVADSTATYLLQFGMQYSDSNGNMHWPSAIMVTVEQGKSGWAKYVGTLTVPYDIGSDANWPRPWLEINGGASDTGWYVTGLSIKDITEAQAAQKAAGDAQSPAANRGLAFPIDFGQTGNAGNTGMIENNGSYTSMPVITAHGRLDGGLTIHWHTSDGNEGDLSFNGSIQNVPVTINTDSRSAIMGGLDVSYQLGSRDWPRIPAGGSCSFALLASGNGWVSIQSHDTYM